MDTVQTPRWPELKRHEWVNSPMFRGWAQKSPAG
ncbi:MAG: hypothetical protein RL375_1768 [Pseudomonadota bacterium]